MAEITGRDGWLTAVALFVAIRALRSKANPPESDIAGMEKILRERYSGLEKTLCLQNNIRLARRLGFKFEEGVSLSPHDVQIWLGEHCADSNMVALFDQQPSAG